MQFFYIGNPSPRYRRPALDVVIQYMVQKTYKLKEKKYIKKKKKEVIVVNL